jgi:hypothetical protein
MQVFVICCVRKHLGPMKGINWLLVILVVISCNEHEPDPESCPDIDLNPSKRIAVIKWQDDERQFYYDCNKLIKIKSIASTGDEYWQEFKYVDDLVSEVSYYGETATYSYNGGQLTGLFRNGSGRFSDYDCYFKYNSAGKVDSVIGTLWSPGLQITVRNKLAWNGDNIQKCIVEREVWSLDEHSVGYDTVSYEYGDELNPYYENIYSPYTFLKLSYGEAASAPNLSKNVLLKESRQGGQYFSLFQYEFDQENSPVKITETGTTPQTSYILVTEIEYD